MSNPTPSEKSRDALRRTLFEYDLSASHLARSSGLTESQISGYKHGTKDLTTESWFKLVSVLPKDALCYYLDFLFELRYLPSDCWEQSSKKLRVADRAARQVRTS